MSKVASGTWDCVASPRMAFRLARPASFARRSRRSIIAGWMPFLQWLDLNDTKITDAGLWHLKGLKHLRRLDVRKTNVTEAGVEDLRRALPGAEILR
jgi:hypothetical protein